MQSTLPMGMVADVRREVNLRLDLFKDGGLILGPTHQIQLGMAGAHRDVPVTIVIGFLITIYD